MHMFGNLKKKLLIVAVTYIDHMHWSIVHSLKVEFLYPYRKCLLLLVQYFNFDFVINFLRYSSDGKPRARSISGKQEPKEKNGTYYILCIVSFSYIYPKLMMLILWGTSQIIEKFSDLCLLFSLSLDSYFIMDKA